MEHLPRHRGLFWTAVAVAVAMVVSGGVVAFLAYQDTSGPGGAVRGYFAALGRSDAAAALGFGDVPAGPHTLLTRTVLKEQERLAPIRDVNIIATARHGRVATVTVEYRLNFPDGAQQAVDSVDVVKHGRSWRLARTAVPTTLHLNQALNRATILGAGIPSGTVLLFPGALPITFDSPYLALEPGTAAVRLSDPADTEISVAITPAGQAAVKRALSTAMTRCLAGGAHTDPRCPLPSERYVPGSLHATMGTSALAKLRITLDTDPDGVIDIRADDVPARGRYQRLDFNNLRVAGSGAIRLPVAATAYAREPIVIAWSAP